MFLITIACADVSFVEKKQSKGNLSFPLANKVLLSGNNIWGAPFFLAPIWAHKKTVSGCTNIKEAVDERRYSA